MAYHRDMHSAKLQRRVDRILLLLTSNDDVYEGVTSRQERSVTGFSDPHVRTMLCGGCAGDGCASCERQRDLLATEGVELKPGRVRVTERDPYDNGQTGFWAGPEQKTMSDQQVDRELERLDEQRRQREGILGGYEKIDGNLDRARLRDRWGDYARVRLGLEMLVLHSAEIREQVSRGEFYAAAHALALAIPGPIRVPRWAYEEELSRLGDEVDSLKKHGYSFSEIAETLSISRRQARSLASSAR